MMKEYKVTGLGQDGQPRGPTVYIDAENKRAARKIAEKLLQEKVWTKAVAYEFKD